MITFTSNHGDVAGGEIMLLAMADAARAAGRSVTVVAPATPDACARAALAAGHRTVTIAGSDRRAYLTGLRAWDAAERRGLLWCNGLVPALATAGRSRRVVHLHQRPLGVLRAAARVALAGADAVVVPSVSMQSVLPGARVLPNWTIATPAVRSIDPAAPAAPLRLGFLGRPSPDKGVVVLLGALAELQRRRPGAFTLTLAGEPRFVSPADRALVEQALAPVAPLVSRPGWLTRDAFFDAVDLAVFPSVWPEPFGLVVAEAMAAGCPFVVSDAGALGEVAGAEHPWVAPAGDAQALADVIESAAADLTRGLAAASRRWHDQFSPEAGGRRFAALLEALDPRTDERSGRG